VVAAIPVQADVTDPEGQRALMTAAEEVLGPVGVLVNNAGGDLQREFHHLTRDDLERMLRVDLSAPIELAHLLLPGMLQRGRGHTVNISSFAGRTGFPHAQAYAAAKDGLIGFTRVMRTDYRRAGVSDLARTLAGSADRASGGCHA
jgi:2-hydroxycyclohexanecarboxyl-CoA dehydrogenase